MMPIQRDTFVVWNLESEGSVSMQGMKSVIPTIRRARSTLDGVAKCRQHERAHREERQHRGTERSWFVGVDSIFTACFLCGDVHWV